MSGIELKITNPQKHIKAAQPVDSKMTRAEKVKMAGAAKDFEAMLASMMLKSMTQTTGGLFGSEGFGGEYFDSIFENEIASHMTKGKGFGIAESIYKKVTGEDFDPTLLNKTTHPMGEKLDIKIKAKGNDFPFLTPSKKSETRVNKYEDVINAASKKYGIDNKLIKSVILTESAGNLKAVSSAKAKGLMQLMDNTAKEMGVKNSFDPVENIMGGTKYLSQLIKKYNGDLKLSLAAYNAGPGNVEKYDGIPPFDETKSYITKVLGYLNYLDG